MKFIGKGLTASVYLYNETTVVKIFIEGFSEVAIEKEKEKAMYVAKYIKNAPKCFGIIRIDNQIGLLYEYIEGVNLTDYFFSNMNNNFIQLSNMLINSLVSIHKDILSNVVDSDSIIIDYRNFLKKNIKDKLLLEEINNLPTDNHLCHGDYHPGNLMINPLTKQVFVIDFNNVVKGPVLYDIARTYFLISSIHVEEDRAILDLKIALANEYLKGMGYQIQDIEPFLNVIRKTRKYELGE